VRDADEVDPVILTNNGHIDDDAVVEE